MKGVPLGAIGLVAAVWVSLLLAQSTATSGSDAAAVQVTVPDSVPGFRADAWFLPDDSLLGFVPIPEGPFWMGSDPAVDPLAFDVERWSTDAFQGQVEVPEFFIGRFEVTVAQYAAFVSRTGHPLPDPSPLDAPPHHPVTNVSWPDALAYARWLDGALEAGAATPPELRVRLEGGWRVGLPSEAEWEKAARGDDGRIYPWGNRRSTDLANYRSRTVEPVGSRACPTCAHGLSDMAGNVWEFTRSPYRPYPFEPALGGLDLAADPLWVMRGGSFQDTDQMVRAAVRGGVGPGARRPFLGFRVVLSRF